MSDHYYSNEPTAAHDRARFDFDLLGNLLTFTTDSSVFSRHTVDFGSRVLLSVIPEVKVISGPILDVGCGYGPIGLALAKYFPERQVTLTDVNQRALQLAKENAVANRIENVQIKTSDGYAQVQDTYAAILTNPPIRAGKAVVDRILQEAEAHLLPGGQLLAVLQKKQGAPSAKRLLTAAFGNCQVLKRDKGYYILQSFKK
ncbi:class I SAM-dependent methyltransferase [Agrilactobacillus fermenti]|uniref:class I SAM-dependent methyltransferase n=1 Tax=Agrilactobacillus fermenti TaxID=2586909 RepID=UPI001E30E0AA|nr:class I SAM-dependent methyltransferase [Agrilactobacillus fermenti]MCD2255438.1 class I SAM-dependent methyltransferase [Agrilactobacillus fermenti]